MKLTKSLLAIALIFSGGVSGSILASSSCGSCSTSCSDSCGSCSFNSCCSVSCTCTTKCDDSFAKPVFLPRSQGENRVRDYVGQAMFQNLSDRDDWNWVASFAFEYTQNFNRAKLGSYFFPNGCNKITVGPDSSQPNSTGVDVRNVDLGLSPTFIGTLTIMPRIQNWIFEPSFYLGLDRWVEGLYLWTKLPIVHTTFDLDCCQTTSFAGGAAFCVGQMAATSQGNVAVGAATVSDAFKGATFGAMTQKLCGGKILCCEESKTGVADLPVHLGWNFMTKENWYLGVYARVVFPTGGVKSRHSIFDPYVGYDRWQLGGGVDAAWKFWERDEDTSLSAYLDFYVTHIFSRSSCRTFDLAANGKFSRYLLIKEFDSTGALTGNMYNVVDKFSACAESKFNWNLEGLLFLELKHKAWTFDLGYNAWAREHESISCDCLKLCNPCTSCDDDSCGSCSCDSTTSSNVYGIKGGVDYSTSCFGVNAKSVGTDFDTRTASGSTITDAAAADTTQTFISTDNLSKTLDIKGARIPRAFSNKVFGNIGYNWLDRDYPIYVNVGGEAEWGAGNRAVSQWGVFAKVGVAYN